MKIFKQIKKAKKNFPFDEPIPITEKIDGLIVSDSLDYLCYEGMDLLDPSYIDDLSTLWANELKECVDGEFCYLEIDDAHHLAIKLKSDFHGGYIFPKVHYYESCYRVWPQYGKLREATIKILKDLLSYVDQDELGEISQETFSRMQNIISQENIY